MKIKLGMIGCGAIGSDVAKAADNMDDIKEIYLYDIDKKASENLNKSLKKSKISTVDDFLDSVDVVFEAASQQAVKEYAEKTITAGKDLIIMSIGSLFDDDFRNKLKNLAQKNKGKIYLPSGAVCGIDGVLSANITDVDEVTLVTTKPPKALDKDFDKRTVVFKGNA
ncbi:MAG: Gfo/Idh/MocA family oxidoreductase, partial [Candidatus Thermoplasmatota archaeon]